MLDVCLLGTGGTQPLVNRWLTSLMVRYKGHSVLIDCGEGTQVAAARAGVSLKPVDKLLLTHLHADHVSGLPGLLLSMANAGREEPLSIVGPVGTERVVKSLRCIAKNLPFDVRVSELETDEETMYLKPLQRGETVEVEGKVYTPDMVLGAPRRGIKVTYCTDTRPTPGIAPAAAGSDLFICEGMYGNAEMLPSGRENQHLLFAEAAQIARDAGGVRELWLTHYSPSMPNPKAYRDIARAIFPNTYTPRDGWCKSISFEDDEEESAN